MYLSACLGVCIYAWGMWSLSADDFFVLSGVRLALRDARCVMCALAYACERNAWRTAGVQAPGMGAPDALDWEFNANGSLAAIDWFYKQVPSLSANRSQNARNRQNLPCLQPLKHRAYCSHCSTLGQTMFASGQGGGINNVYIPHVKSLRINKNLCWQRRWFLFTPFA
jgi:hypothetical protein